MKNSKNNRGSHPLSLWATNVLDDPKTVIFDLETTGLLPKKVDDVFPEIMEMSIVDAQERILFSGLIRTITPLTYNNSVFSGVWDRELDGLPTLEEYTPIIQKIMSGRTAYSYNLAFDLKVIQNWVDLPYTSWGFCIMEAYSKFMGSNRWLKLPKLTTDGQAHQSCTDCISAIRVLKTIAGTTWKNEQKFDF